MAAKALTLTKLDMDEALASGQIQLAYQPIFSLADGSVVRVEALVRWEHPRLGTMLPAVFLPAFEAEDRLSALTRRVLERAAAEFGSWAYRKPSGLSVNLSPLDMVDQQLPAVLKAVIDSARLEPQQLTLECPTAGIHADAARAVLIEIKKLGVRLAAEIMRAPECVADAFDLAPFDEVKTSGRGLLRAARNNHSATLTGAADLLTYADAKGAVVTAIGAEDSAACLALRTVGFQQVQANVLAPALPIDAVTPRVTNGALEMLGFGSKQSSEEPEIDKSPIAEMSAFYQQRRRAQGEMLRRAAEQRVAQESEAALLSEKGIRAVQDVLAESYAEAPESSEPTTAESGDQEATMEAQSKAGLLMRPDLASASLGYGASKLRSAPRPRINDTRQQVAKAISDVLESLPAEVNDRDSGGQKIERPEDVLDAEVAKLPTLSDDELAQAAPHSPVHEELRELASKLKAAPRREKSFLQRKYKLRVTHFWPKPWKRTYLRVVHGLSPQNLELPHDILDPLNRKRCEQNTVAVVALGDDDAGALTVSFDDGPTSTKERTTSS